MKIEDLKVGMKVKATGGSKTVYNITNEEEKWVGTVIYIDVNDERFSAKTDSCDFKGAIKKSFEDLNPRYFEPVKEKPTITKKQEKELLRVTEHNKEIKVYYKDKLITKAKCSEEDNYDEEFGLNLALRRFCKTLKDSHEVVITKTERVDDYL